MKTQHGRDLTGEEMAEMLDEFCNSAYNDKVESFVTHLTTRTHRTLQQRIMSLFMSSIESWAKTSHFDARNEATILLCKKIVTATGDKYDRMLPFI